MNSLEALRILSECANGEKKLIFSDSLNLESTIKQDLERLEKLEEKIKELKSIIEEQSLKIANDSKEMSDMNLQIRQLKGEFMPLDCPK